MSSRIPDSLATPNLLAKPESLAQPDGGFDPLSFDASFNFECDWEGAINFRPGSHAKYGYLLSWSGFGGLSLEKDITLANPFSSGGQSPEVTSPDPDDKIGTVLKCVGVIHEFKFRGLTKTDPIRISAYVSKKSAAALHHKFSGSVLSRTKSKTALDVSWYIIACDGTGKRKWYEAAHIQGFQEASANIATDQGKNDPGGELKVKIERESPGLKGGIDIRLYRFEFEIVPAAGAVTQLHFETGYEEKAVREWG